MKTRYWKFTWGIVSTLLLITVMAGGVQASCVNPGGTDGCHASIQAAINAASPGDAINVAAGTYTEHLTITKTNLTISGNGSADTFIDASTGGGYGITVSGDQTVLEKFTLIGSTSNSAARYGIHVSGSGYDAQIQITIRNVLVKNWYRSGIDLNGVDGAILSDLESLDNQGFGISTCDARNVTFQNIAVSGNAWGDIGIMTWGRYHPLGTSGIVFTGTNSVSSFLQLEEGDYNNPGVAPSGEAVITYSADPADGVDVTVQLSDFGYTMHGTQDDSPAQVRIMFFSTLENALAAGVTVPFSHFTTNRYVRSLTDGSFWVGNNGANAMSIQAAIDAADPGDTVNVVAGTYTENVNVNKSVTIQGNGPTSTSVVSAGTVPVFTISADNVTIQQIGITHSTQLVEGIRVISPAASGLTLDSVHFPNLGNSASNAYGVNITNSFTGLSVTNSEFIATNLGVKSRAIGIFAGNNYLLRDFEVQDSTFEYLFVGIYLRSDIDGLDVTGNTFGPFEPEDCTAAVAGIYIGDGSQGNFDIQNITVTENTFTNYGRGVYMWNYSHGDIIGKVDITNNTFTNTIWSSGIRFIGKLNPTTQVATLEGPITIDNNTFTQSVDVGGSGGVAMIDFRAGGESATSQIAVTNNDITFIDTFISATYGIVFRGPITNVAVSGNTLNGNSAGGTIGGQPSTSGIIVFTNDSSLESISSNAVVDISNNVIAGFENGVAVYDRVANVFGNLPVSAELSIHNNSITANTLGINSGLGKLTDASGNWWGANAPAGVASQVTAAAVDYTPWLDSGTDIGAPGFQGDFSTLHVDDDSPQVGATGRIQEAIDLVTGSTIYIAAGTYAENVNVNKSVQMIGAGSGDDPASNTIITQTTAGAGDTKIGVVQLSASGMSDNPILLQDMRLEPVGMAGISVGHFTEGTGQTVEHVKLDNVQVVGTNANPSTEQERGLYVDLTSTLHYLDVDDCAFDNLTYGWYLQKAVSADDDSTVQYVTVDNTTFNHNNHKGLYAEKLSDATFTECTADGNGFDSSVLPSYFAPWSAGIDINLKAGTYANLAFMSCTITNNANDQAREGVGLTVKARDDGSYNAYPAMLENVTIEGGLFSGNERGIRIGEPSKNNAGPTNVQVHYNNIAGNVQNYSGTDGSEYGGLLNHTQVQVHGTCNWWGAADGPSGAGSGSGDAVSGNVEFIPWLLDLAPDGECAGYPLEGITIEKSQELEFERGSDPLTETPFVHHGDEIMYSVEVTNTFAQAVDVLISDAMSAYVDYLSGSLKVFKDDVELDDPDKEDSITYDEILDEYSLAYTFDSLGINETLKLEFLVQVEDLVPLGEWIENFATVFVTIPGLTFEVDSDIVRVEVVPEPATLFLIGAGLLGIGALVWKKRKQ